MTVTHDGTKVRFKVNVFHTAGECRRQVKNVTKFVKKIKIVIFHDHIWNRNEKGIRISANIPGFGSLIREIYINISKICERKYIFAQ